MDDRDGFLFGILYASTNGVQITSHRKNLRFWISKLYVLVGRPTALPVSHSPTLTHLLTCFWVVSQQKGWPETNVLRTDRTFRMLRTDVSAMIYRVLEIENRHGSADDQFAVASQQGFASLQSN